MLSRTRDRKYKDINQQESFLNDNLEYFRENLRVNS